MSKAKTIKDAFRSAALEFGFEGADGVYRKTLDEVIWVIELVKERGTLYGIACGSWIRYLPKNDPFLKEINALESSPGFSMCHVRPDLERLSRTRGKYRLKELLDSKSEIDDEERIERIKLELERFLMPALAQLANASDCCRNGKTVRL